MLKKGDQTKTTILQTAKVLFAEKGFSAVTMKDFCDRLGLSRGGLYRYFDSPKTIFVTMLDLEKESSTQELDEAIAAGIPARKIFDYLIQQQKQDIHQGAGRLSMAVHEFCLAHPEQKPYLDRRYVTAVEILEKLIRYGQDQQAFTKVDARETAAHIVVFLEGLRLSSAVITFTASTLEDQLRYLYTLIGVARQNVPN